MKINQNKSKISTIALILILTISAIIVALPTITAQEPYRKKTYPVIEAIPNLVGVNQVVLLAVGITDPVNRPMTGWEDLTVTVEKPDGTTETLGPITTDFNGLTGILYTPNQVGTYTFQTHFPEQVSISSTRGYPPGTVFEASVSEKFELIVQEEQLPWYPGIPLPTEYWSRPIDAQAREWYTIGGNWLNIEPIGRAPRRAINNDYAPETAHILWAKPILGGAFSPLGGGLAGGATETHSYEDGDAYEGKFTPPIIIGGVLFLNRERSQSSSSALRVAQEVVAVDLRTGEELWAKPLIDPNGVSRRLSFGQIYSWDGYNIHGVYAYLWATSGSTWHAFEPHSGRWIYSMTNVPSGMNVVGPNGEIIRYTVNLNNGWMTKWSTERVVNNDELTGYAPGSWLYRAEGTTFDGRLGIEWNKTIPTGLPGTARVALEDRLIGTNFRSGAPAPETLSMWAINTKIGQEGDLLFNVTWTRPLRDVYMQIGYSSTGTIMSASVEDGVFIVSVSDTMQHFGIDIDTGAVLWGPTASQPIADRFSFTGPDIIYNGIYYSGFMGGVLHAYNVTTGDLLWTYENEDPYVFTERWQRELGANYFSIHTAFVTDGKLYIPDSEHSPNDPKSRGAPFTCLNATTGEEIWKVYGMFKGSRWGGHAIIGDSIIVTQDTYDQRVYAIGKGPSKITVTPSPEVSKRGSSVLVTGIVTDISAGTEDHALAARFPNGVPAIADEDMSEWMLYVYKQFPRPVDATGVPVTLEAIDPNGNYQYLGTATTDAYGNYGFAFEPDVPGPYMIMATFYGSGAYYGSTTTTYLMVDPTPEPYPTVTIPSYPGYQGPTAQDVAQNVLDRLPDDPTANDIAQEVLNQLPEAPETPEYTTIDLILIIAVIVVAALVVYTIYTVRKLK